MEDEEGEVKLCFPIVAYDVVLCIFNFLGHSYYLPSQEHLQYY